MKISIQFSPLVTMTLAETRSTDNWRKTAAFQMQKQISVLPPTKIYFFQNFFFRQRLINLKIIKDEIDFFSNMELLRAAAVKKCLKKITFFIYFKHFSKKHLIFCCHRVGQLNNQSFFVRPTFKSGHANTLSLTTRFCPIQIKTEKSLYDTLGEKGNNRLSFK